MSEKFQLHTVQNVIGYSFKNPSLLVTAFTHPSAASKDSDTNEGLIFLGKAVCELLIRDYLYSNFMKLETVKVSVASAESRVSPLLKKLCDDNGLAEYMLLAPSASALKLSRTVENELFLALVGAIYKDGGMPSTRAFVLPKLRAVISDDEPELMREAKKDIIKKSGNKHDIFSDHSDVSEKRSTASALKSLFSSRKKKSESVESLEHNNGSRTADRLEKSEKDVVKPEPSATVAKESKTPSIKQPQRETKPPKPQTPAQVAAEVNGYAKEPSDGNYKSALQEYVQKNIRSATVMLEYKDTRSSDGCTTEIYLFGKKISKATGANKKEASQLAAKQAYHAITATSGDAAAWFRHLKSDPNGAMASTDSTGEPDYISDLNHTYQKKLRRSDASLKYESIPAKTKKMIAYAVVAGGERLGVGEGRTAKEAKQNAARSALMMLGKL